MTTVIKHHIPETIIINTQKKKKLAGPRIKKQESRQTLGGKIKQKVYEHSLL